MALKRRDIQLSAGEKPALPTTNFTKHYPLLWEFLITDRYEDGTERKLPSLTIFLGPDGLQACLNDRDQSLVAFVTAMTVDDLWRALERGLGEDRLDWRRSQGGGDRKKKK